MCKIKACSFSWELSQFVPSCYSVDNRPRSLYNGWSSLDWLAAGFLSFVLLLTFTFSEGNSVRNFIFSSNSEVDTPKLFLVVLNANMVKYGSILSYLRFRRVLLMVWIALHKLITLRELGTGCLVYEVPWFGKVHKFMWTVLGSIVTKYLGYAISYKYTSHVGNDCIWWGIW